MSHDQPQSLRPAPLVFKEICGLCSPCPGPRAEPDQMALIGAPYDLPGEAKFTASFM